MPLAGLVAWAGVIGAYAIVFGGLRSAAIRPPNVGLLGHAVVVRALAGGLT